MKTQLLDLWRYTLGGTNPPRAASASGDIAQMVKYLAANSPTEQVLQALGLGKVYPFLNGVTTDLVINGADQTVTPTNGVLRYRSITFQTAHSLIINATPCILIVETLTWNAAGVIHCARTSAPSLGANPTAPFCRGGRAVDGAAEAIGGYGGGFLIVLAGTVNGSTAGAIRANGTAANRNTTVGATRRGRGGEGALSSRLLVGTNAPTTLFGTAEVWVGANTSANADAASGGPPGLAALALGAGGEPDTAGTAYAGYGGGSGRGTDGSPGSQAGGGSGVGGGGAAAGGAPQAPKAALVQVSLPLAVQLYLMGCRGGGGGAGYVDDGAGTNNAGGGGGGGLVALVVDTETQVTTLEAAGGAGVGAGTAGGAGVTIRQVI